MLDGYSMAAAQGQATHSSSTPFGAWWCGSNCRNWPLRGGRLEGGEVRALLLEESRGAVDGEVKREEGVDELRTVAVELRGLRGASAPLGRAPWQWRGGPCERGRRACSGSASTRSSGKPAARRRDTWRARSMSSSGTSALSAQRQPNESSHRPRSAR